MLSSRDFSQCRFVWLLSPPWDGVPTRQIHFSRRLARLGAEVLYVENPSAWSSILRQRRWRELPFGPESVREIEPNLRVLRPGFALPGSTHSDAIAWLNAWFLARGIKRVLHRLDWKEYLAWCRVPVSVFALERLSPRGVIYDVTDDYELYARPGRERVLTGEREYRIAALTGRIFVTAEVLRSKTALAPRGPILLPNGVEYELFASAAEPGATAPLLAGLRRPIIGYVGVTSHWMNFDLLRQLGNRWPGHVLMVGPIHAQVEAKARAIPGVVWAGFVPQPELPPYMRGMNVLIMPHQVSELRRRANPLKVWEYLATGKPFVSVDLPALEPVRHLVDVANDRDHFLALVAKRMEADAADAPAARQAFAKSYSWDVIFDRLVSHISPMLTSPS